MTIENKFLEWRTGWSFQILRLHEMKKSKREGHFYNETGHTSRFPVLFIWIVFFRVTLIAKQFITLLFPLGIT